MWGIAQKSSPFPGMWLDRVQSLAAKFPGIWMLIMSALLLLSCSRCHWHTIMGFHNWSGDSCSSVCVCLSFPLIQLYLAICNLIKWNWSDRRDRSAKTIIWPPTEVSTCSAAWLLHMLSTQKGHGYSVFSVLQYLLRQRARKSFTTVSFCQPIPSWTNTSPTPVLICINMIAAANKLYFSWDFFPNLHFEGILIDLEIIILWLSTEFVLRVCFTFFFF